MDKAIYFDMDGTIANLYGVKDWLPKLQASNPSPYEQAKPLCNMQALARLLNGLQKKGYNIGIVSWLSKNGTKEYNEQVIKAKRKWLDKHLKSVNFDEINIGKHGTPKSTMVKHMQGILFDDEIDNRKHWQGQAFPPENIFEELKYLSKNA